MLSKRVQNLKPSPTLALAAKAKELRAQGQDVISLSVGEPDWDTFQSIKNAAILAIENGETKYMPSNGLLELRQAICEQTNQDLGTQYSPDQVTVSSGGKFVIFSALQALLDPGDEVLIPSPYWVSYPTEVELAEGKPIILETSKENNFKLTPEALAKAIRKKTKMLILNSPSNPSGVMYSSGELEALGKVLLDHPQVYILSDDIYNRLVFNEEGLAPHILQTTPELVNQTLVLNGVSKTYSMTGWRVGWALGPKDIIGAMTKYQSQSVSCACSIAQKASLQAVKGGEPELKDALIKLKKRRDRVFELLSQSPKIEVEAPDGAFYIWPDISRYLNKSYKGKALKTSKDFAETLLETKQVAVVPGVEFGVEGYLRLSYALSEERMVEAIERFNSFLSEIE